VRTLEFIGFIWILFVWDSNLNSKFKYESYLYRCKVKRKIALGLNLVGGP
jgi:hypothetical protein